MWGLFSIYRHLVFLLLLRQLTLPYSSTACSSFPSTKSKLKDYIYALVDLDFHIEGWGSGHLAAKELLVVETKELPPRSLHLTACQACQKPKALIAKLRSTDLGRNMI